MGTGPYRTTTLPPVRALVAAADPWIRWDWIGDHGDTIGRALREHLALTGIAIVAGFAVAAPLAVAAWRWRRLEPLIVGAAGVVYTIPSLALFALLVPWTGLSRTTAEIGLAGYTLLALVRNMLVGLADVPPDVREAATGMGFSWWRRFTRVEVPLALPAIIAGIRIATVTTIGLVTVTALIGQGGLGVLILDGLQRDFRTPIVVGSALSLVLAAGADGALLVVERALTPWARRRA
jgi:osmoprotectant transport system permease protein